MIWRAHTFGPTGLPIPPQAPPALRVEGGIEATAQQRAMAQVVFAQYCSMARLSLGPNPIQSGLLPDGTPYKITSVGPQTVMQIWPVGAGEDLLELLPGIRFPATAPSQIDGAFAYIIVSPPRQPTNAWSRKTIDVSVNLGAALTNVNIAPLGYRKFRQSFKAPNPAGYFFHSDDGGDDTAYSQFGGLVRIERTPGTTTVANAAFTSASTVILASLFNYFGSDRDKVFAVSEPYVAPPVSLKGTGREYKRVKGQPWDVKTVTTVEGDPDLTARLLSLPNDYHYEALPVNVVSFAGAKELIYVQARKKLSDRLNDATPGLRYFQFPGGFLPSYELQKSIGGPIDNRYYGYEFRLFGTTLPLFNTPAVEDIEDRTFGLLIDCSTAEIEQSIDFPSLVQYPPPFVVCRWWDASISGGITGMKQERLAGVGMRCTASGPVPTYSWNSAAISPPGTYRISTAATFSGPVSLHGISEIRREYLLDPAFVGGTVELASVTAVETFEITVAGSRSFSLSGSTTVSGAPPEEPEVTNIYTAPVYPGGGGAQSYDLITELEHSDERRADLGEFGTLYLRKHSLLETTSREGSGAITTDGVEADSVHEASATQQWHFEQRTVYVFDPELHLLCYFELIHDGESTMTLDTTVPGGSFNAYPMPPDSEIPQYRVVIQHRAKKTVLASKMAFIGVNADLKRKLFVTSYHPSAGVPPGFPGGPMPSIFAHAAFPPNGGYWGRQVTPLLSTEIGYIVNSHPMSEIPTSVTTDVATGEQPSGEFLANYSGRGRFEETGLDGLSVRYQRSPDGLGAILHITRASSEYPVPDFGEKTFLVTAATIKEMPAEMRVGLDFASMQPF